MSKRARSTSSPQPPGSAIPGGKALATYVAQVAVAHQNHAWAKQKTVYEANLKFIRKYRSRLPMPTMACISCGLLGNDRDIVGCGRSGCANRCCSGCLRNNYCSECYGQCVFKDCGKEFMKHYMDMCVGCGEVMCDTHKQHCVGCGERLCWHPDHPERTAACQTAHDCQEPAARHGKK